MHHRTARTTAKFARGALGALAAALLLAGRAAAQQPTMPPVTAPYGTPAPGMTPPGAAPWQSYPSVPPPTVQIVVGRASTFMQRTAQGGWAAEFIGPVAAQWQPGYSKTSGLQLSIEVPTASQFGYQRILVTVRSQQPATKDRSVVVQFHAGGWAHQGGSINVAQALTLKSGETSATAALVVPQYQNWPVCGWDVSVDRRNDDELSVEWTNYSHQQSHAVAALVASPKLAGFDLQTMIGHLSNSSAVLQSCTPAELPDQWLKLSTFDLVMLAADDLPTLADAKLQALQRWVRTGGNLWLFECGEEWERARSIERTLGVDRRRGAGNAGDGEDADLAADERIVSRGWRFVPLGDRALEPLEGALAISGFAMEEEDEKEKEESDQAEDATNAVDAAADALAGSIEPPQSAMPRLVETSQGHFVVRGHGLGTVTMFPGFFPREYDGDATLVAIQRSLLMPRLSFATRHGTKPDEANHEFNNLLIPGVGVAPVGQFQFLITLFVLGIGPLNYWWLKRKKRLPLLLATVPAAATLVTLLLLVYGVLADGVGVRARVRSLTMLDQGAGEASTWARTTYYAGMNPRGGLTLPSDTGIYPILSEWSISRYGDGSSARRELRWNDGQRLVSGWLPSRTSTQYLTVSARPSTKRLDLRATDEGLRVVNRLGATVTHLVVQDHDGKLYWGENLQPDQGVVVQPADPLKISGRLRQLFSDNLPEFPPGASSTYYYGYGMSSGHLLSTNLMESQLSAINSPVIEKWIDGSYLAVTDRGVEVDLGLENVAEEASFHLIQGRWTQ